MKKLYKISIQFLVLFLVTYSLFAQDVNYWSKSDDSRINKKLITGPTMPKIYEIYQLDESSFRANMTNVPSETTVYAGNSNKIISFPTLNGRIERFRVVEAPVMHADLAARYPGIHSYAGKGIDDPTATVRFDVSPLGTNAMILYSDKHTVYVDRIESNYYRVSSRADQNPHTTFHCNTDYFEQDRLNLDLTGRGMDATQPKLRTYRLALLSGAEWSATFFGTATTDAQKKANVLIEQNREMTRANGIFERDFAVRLVLVPTNDSIIYLNAATDPINNVSSPNQATCQTAINNKIGASNYDIGHTESRATTGQSNGNAGCIGCVCGSSNAKGTAFTSYDNPTALDYYVVDYLTHEMGHQMGANHTFSHNDEGSGVQMEPGSGITIMGYAGITGSTDIAQHSIDNFHSKSVQQVTAFMYSTTLSNTSTACGVIPIVNTNAIPTANAGANYTIPKSTPFQLTGAGTDADVTDTLSYCWEQIDDNNPSINLTSFPNATYTAGPAFRPYSPVRTNIRIVPQLQYILSGANTTKWEVLPSVARTINFRLLVRDNHVGCGGNKSDDMAITVDGNSGPFKVTAPNTTGISWTAGTSQTITWDVANSTAAPVNCAKVKISLSTDGGNTFPIVLADSTDNDGTETITIPNNPTTTGRIKVEAVRNIFFDINDKNITITGLTTGFTFGTTNPASVSCGTSTATVQLPTNSLGGFTTPINLTANNVPAGASVSFGSNPVTPGSPAVIILNNMNALAQGTYNISITGVAGTINQTTTVTFVVNSLVPTFTQVAPVCIGSSFTLPSTSDNGVNGTWTPAINNQATTTYTFNPTANPCASSATMTVVVTTSIAPIFTQVAPICIGSSFTLPGTSNNGISGSWSPAINNQATTTYHFTPNAGQCGDTTSMTVVVNATPAVPLFTQVAPICVGGTFTLPITSTNEISGTWSPVLNNQNTTTYTFTPVAGACATTTTMTVTVNPNITPVFDQVAAICFGGSFTLPTTSNNGVNGSWSPSPNNTSTTTYTFTPASGFCASTTTMTVTVNQPTVPTFTQVAPICAGGTFTLPTTSNNGIAGTWFPAINNQGTTTYSFVPNAGLCATVANMTVSVNQPTVPTFSQVAPICAGSSFTLPTTSNNGVSGSWSPAINNQTTTTYTFTPSAGQCASTTTMTVTVNPVSNTAVNQTSCSSFIWNGITYTASGTYTNNNGCSTDTLHLTINQPTVPTFTQVAAICVGGSFTLPTTSNNGVSGSWAPAINNQVTTTYTFTPASGACATSATMTVTVKQTSSSNTSANVCATSLPYLWNGISCASAGTYTKVFAGGNAVGCDSTAYLTLTVNTTPTTPNFTQVAAICAGGSFTLPSTSTNGVSGSWSPSINNQTTTTYTFTPNAGQCVSATVVTMTVTVNQPVTPTFNQVAAVCYGANINLPATSNNGVSGSWSPAINNQATTTYTFTPTAGSCATSTTMTVTVTPQSPAPTGLACYETATWNSTTCQWDVSGTQPTRPTTACYETATFNTTSCSWVVTGTQPTRPTTACYETATFNNTTCSWDVTGTQPTRPTTACYETATFNTTSCSWVVTGTQPTRPTLACNETAVFNNDSCNWIITTSSSPCNGSIVYPNPTKSGIVSINWANANIKVGTKVQVIVYDRIGRVVSRRTETVRSSVENDFDLNLKGYSNGLYVVTLEVLYTNYKYSEKIIKQDTDQ